MHRVLALYPPPKDPAHFKKYYEEKHLPLAAQMPGLLSSRHSFAIEGITGPSPYFCIWEGEFANEAAMAAASQSEIGQKVAADVANYATGGVTILHFDVAEPSHNGSRPAGTDTFAAGLQLRREMFGLALAEQAVNSATDFTRPLQEIVTRYCFGEIWTRPPLDRRTRSLLTIATLIALGKPVQLRAHVRAAITNGATKDEIREVLLHGMIYCGVPAGVDSFNHAAEVLKEMGLE
ncbi:MAG TPA: EthD family reductase [Candidatus Baltobacteraceae bacterium]|nr:EthD family reductase [Candidatus Baltobacteraceae bacterium]